ncbi:MAG: hypothetical protein ACLFRV_10925 [Acidimicrobiales bacterium]
MDLSKLSTSDKVISGSAIALLIFSFFPWFSADTGGFGPSYSESGWDFFLTGILPVLLGIVMLAHVAITAFSPDTKLPDLPATWGQIHLGAGAASAVLVLLRLLMGAEVGGFNLDRSFGIFLAAVAAIGLAAGGFLKFQEEKSGSTSAPPSSF